MFNTNYKIKNTLFLFCIHEKWKPKKYLYFIQSHHKIFYKQTWLGGLTTFSQQ